MTYSIIIPNYNGKHLLAKNLPKVLAECSRTRATCNEIIIVDDASEDGSADWVEGYCQGTDSLPARVIVLENTRNLGFSSTVNKGVLRATGDIVVLLNTDTRPEKGYLSAAFPRFHNESLFGVGFMDKSIEHDHVVYRGRGIGWWERGMFIHRRGAVDQPDTSWISGGSCAIRRSMFLELKGFNEIYNPFYWEDIDLSYRALRAGYSLWFESGSVVVHEHEEGSIQTKYSSRDITRIAYRNQFMFIWRNATFMQFLKHLMWLPYHAMRAGLRGDVLFFTGYVDAIVRLLTYR